MIRHEQRRQYYKNKPDLPVYFCVILSYDGTFKGYTNKTNE